MKTLLRLTLLLLTAFLPAQAQAPGFPVAFTLGLRWSNASIFTGTITVQKLSGETIAGPMPFVLGRVQASVLISPDTLYTAYIATTNPVSKVATSLTLPIFIPSQLMPAGVQSIGYTSAIDVKTNASIPKSTQLTVVF